MPFDRAKLTRPRELMDEFGFEDDPEDRERADSSVPCPKGLVVDTGRLVSVLRTACSRDQFEISLNILAEITEASKTQG